VTQLPQINRPVKVQSFFDAHEGLENAFNIARDHHIVDSIYRNLSIYGRLSEKQIACVMNIAAGRTKMNQETFVPAPSFNGRTEVVGTVLATKSQDAHYGYSRFGACVVYKMLVSIETENGNYKAWGSVPKGVLTDLDSLLNQTAEVKELRGRKVAFEATFKVADNDPTMTFFSRPSNGTLINEVN
jgi:hypothetical protein